MIPTATLLLVAALAAPLPTASVPAAPAPGPTATGPMATGPTASAPREDVRAMLEDYVVDYRTDPTAAPITFGIEVHDADPPRWHVVVGAADGAGARAVDLHEGFPDEPAAYFTTDVSTLARMHRGDLASLTAMGKEFDTDYAPLDLGTMPGFQPDLATMQQLVKAAFHFWTRGFPERVRFGKASQTRLLHGAHGTLFYYQEGFRSGFFLIQPGDHVNDAAVSQVNDFPTLFILTKGRVSGRIGDQECEVVEGEALFIGPGVRHEFWVDGEAEEGGEGVLVMFGEGA